MSDIQYMQRKVELYMKKVIDRTKERGFQIHIPLQLPRCQKLEAVLLMDLNF